MIWNHLRLRLGCLIYFEKTRKRGKGGATASMYVAWICHIFPDLRKYRKDDIKGLPVTSMTGHGIGADGISSDTVQCERLHIALCDYFALKKQDAVNQRPVRS